MMRQGATTGAQLGKGRTDPLIVSLKAHPVAVPMPTSQGQKNLTRGSVSGRESETLQGSET